MNVLCYARIGQVIDPDDSRQHFALPSCDPSRTICPIYVTQSEISQVSDGGLPSFCLVRLPS